MVLAGVAISEDKLDKLKELGIKDSKLLSPKRRFELYDKIIKLADSYMIIEVSPKEIDQCNADGTNLNQLEAIKIAEIINQLQSDEIYVDSPEPADGGKKFEYIIKPHLTSSVTTKIYAGNKYDSKYVICAAASILAKVTRDNAVRCITKEIGHDVGSGYPADPKCKAFLENHYKDKHIHHIRTCWATYKTLMKKKNQASLDNW